MKRHRWAATQSMAGGVAVQKCVRCDTERVPDASTKSLFLCRRGRAIPPGHRPRPMDETWAAFRVGVIPSCPEVSP